MPLDGSMMTTDAPATRSRRAWAVDAAKHVGYRAARGGFEATLTADWLEKNLPLVCPVLGIPLYSGGYGGRGPRRSSPTVDRVDVSRGYTPANSLIVSGRANSIKRDLSPTMMRAIAATPDDGSDTHRICRFYAAMLYRSAR